MDKCNIYHTKLYNTHIKTYFHGFTQHEGEQKKASSGLCRTRPLRSAASVVMATESVKEFSHGTSVCCEELQQQIRVKSPVFGITLSLHDKYSQHRVKQRLNDSRE